MMVLMQFLGSRIVVLIIGFDIELMCLLGYLFGFVMVIVLLVFEVMILQIMFGVVVMRLRLNLCVRCLVMIFRCSRLRKLQWKLKLRVMEVFGLYCREVLESLSLLSVLCSFVQLLLLIGQMFEKIMGFGFVQLGRVFVVGLWVFVIVLLIFDWCIFFMLVMRQFILLILSFLVGVGLGFDILILRVLWFVLVDIIWMCLWGDRLLLIMCMQVMMLWQVLYIELKIIVWVGVFVLLVGVGIFWISWLRRFLMLVLVLFEICSMFFGFLLMSDVSFLVYFFGLVVGRLILFSIGMMWRLFLSVRQRFVSV